MAGSDVYVFYHYNPNLPAAIIFAGIFGVATLIHIYQLVRTKTWYFIPFAIGCLFECVGYVGRILSHNNILELGPFIMQTLLLLVAPALYAASVYMILGRIIILTQLERFSPIRVKWLTKIFVVGDVVSFIMQGAGGGILSSGTPSAAILGQRLILVGLFLQLSFFGGFMVATLLFQRRAHKLGHHKIQLLLPSTSRFDWRILIHVLISVSLLIFVRSVFRVVEYLQGNNGSLLQREIYLYIFDGVLVALVSVILIVVHPSHIVPGGLVKLSRNSSHERMLSSGQHEHLPMTSDSQGVRMQRQASGY